MLFGGVVGGVTATVAEIIGPNQATDIAREVLLYLSGMPAAYFALWGALKARYKRFRVVLVPPPVINETAEVAIGA
jgi:hypothetical protein